MSIPKIIHCCWFGKKPIPTELQKYIDSWKVFCPDYQIKIWNEDNFDINSHIFTKTAYAQKKYAYVSDFVRAYALYHFGGIYLDTDIELKHNLDIFLQNEAFSGFERPGLPFTAIWGAIPYHSLTQEVLNYYTDRKYDINQETNTLSVSRIIIQVFNINPAINEIQNGTNGIHSITIYPSEYFCLDLKPNFATHHFVGSWLSDDKKTSYKEHLHVEYHTNRALSIISKANNISSLKALASTLSLLQIFKILIFKIYYLLRFMK